MTSTSELAAWSATLPGAFTTGVDASVLALARDAYCSSGRHHHGWPHVVSCVETLRTMPCDQPRALFLALVFHDAVYIAGRTDNEARSAALARQALADSPVDRVELASIERMILATRDHHALAEGLPAGERTMLDIDLSILGAPSEEYARYAENIRREYVPFVATDAEFRIGRHQFLERLLALPNLFLTIEGRRRWEEEARTNVMHELERLR